MGAHRTLSRAKHSIPPGFGHGCIHRLHGVTHRQSSCIANRLGMLGSRAHLLLYCIAYVAQMAAKPLGMLVSRARAPLYSLTYVAQMAVRMAPVPAHSSTTQTPRERKEAQANHKQTEQAAREHQRAELAVRLSPDSSQ